MPPTARSGAIRTDHGTAEPLDAASDATDTDDESVESGDSGDSGEEKLRSGIQSIEVGFRLLDVLTHEPRAMMLRTSRSAPA